MTIAALDAHYPETGGARVGCVVFARWSDATPRFETATTVDAVAAYEPGAFYKREAPCLLAALAALDATPETIVVDGYATLDPEGRAGLGAHLSRALGRPVIGVAKSAFAGASHARAVLRGAATRPLFVTAIGMDPDAAAERVRAMHGPHRIPTLLARADAIARGAAPREAPREATGD